VLKSEKLFFTYCTVDEEEKIHQITVRSLIRCTWFQLKM